MSNRPRLKINKGLPQNLYFDKRRLSYRYRRPTDGKWFKFGKDRLKAIDAAMQLNLTFMHDADLISNVMAKSPEESETFSAFLALYEDVLLPPRGLAKATLCMYRVHFRRYRKAFEGKRVDEITIRMVAELLDSLPPGHRTSVGIFWLISSITLRQRACVLTIQQRL